MPPSGPLSGVFVLDLTRVLSGPYCTMLLADMGARVVKVERPGEGDETRAWGPPFVAGESAYFLGTNRNKESIALDFKRPEGRRIIHRLLDQADVVVENFRPGTLTRLGLDYAALKEARPKLIHASISGFGQTGPRRFEAGYDAVVQAEGGLMSITGDPDGPPFRVGVAIADLVAGMLTAHGIVLALYAREKTGRGQQVDIGMLDGVVSILSYHASMHLTANIRSRRVGNRHATIAPYDTFGAADGEFFLAVGNDDQFRRFCAAAGLAALPEDPKFANESSARREPHRAARAALANLVRAAPCLLDRSADRGRRPVRRSPGRAGSTRRSADPRARDDSVSGARRRWHAESGGRADQAVRHARVSAHRAADAGTAHRIDSSRLADG